MKLSFEQLVVEVTRRCNMHCTHCMRGDAKQRDLDIAKMAEFLTHVDSIGAIIFTGGEPTLNVEAIEDILQMCRDNRIPVYGFYVATNGKQITSRFLKSMLDWYVYCLECGGDPDYCVVTMSQDGYHEPIKGSNIAKLKALSFYSDKDKRVIWKHGSLIDLGRARNISDCPKRDPAYVQPDVVKESDVIRTRDGVVTFTVDGEILLDCDYEYESTDDLKACDWNKAVETFECMATHPEYIWVLQ